MIREKANLKEWRDKTQRQVRAVAQLFVKMLGADDVALISQGHIADYRTLLLDLPKTYGKNPRDFDRPLADVLAAGKSLPPEKIGRQGTTLNRHLTQLKAIIECVEASGVATIDYKGVHRLRARTEMRARDARAPYSAQDVRGFFAQPPWTGCLSERSRDPGSFTIRFIGYRFWPGPRWRGGKNFVDLTLTTSSKPAAFRLSSSPQRALPAQKPAVDPPYSAAARNCKVGLPRVSERHQGFRLQIAFSGTAGGERSDPVRRCLSWRLDQSSELRDSERRSSKKSFHSFRKMSAKELKDAGVVSELRADILGHGGANITEECYASAAKL